MRCTTLLAAILLLVPSASFPASLDLFPETQSVYHTATVILSADDLVSITGFDIEIIWNSDIITCSAVAFDDTALPGFSPFLQRIDNGAGTLEVVLLCPVAGGYTGAAESFLTLTFEPTSIGTTDIMIVKSYESGDPLCIDHAGTGIEAAADTVEIEVIEEPEPEIPSVARLYQNYPNPFNPATTIRFDLPERSAVTIRIYDVGGMLVKTLLDNVPYEYGSWETEWAGTNERGERVPSGVYFCVFEGGGRTESRKIVILR